LITAVLTIWGLGTVQNPRDGVFTRGRALDVEGEGAVEEGTANVGARHNSAYRLAGALPGSVAVVISQDGGVCWVCRKDGRATFWEQE
jgi:DNA integrity scanning protein DisA with diadenylate cyclase activity